jgi:hypothetical protein
VSEITALSDTEFLIGERDGELQPGGDKKIYVADISGATDVGPDATVPGSTYKADAGGFQVQDKPIETLVGVTTDAEAIEKLKAVGITVASKTLKLDLGGLLAELNDKGEFFGHDKVEGVATPDGGNTLVIANDSDFGLAGIESETPPFALKPKTLANGRPDTASSLPSTPPNCRPKPRRRRCRSRSADQWTDLGYTCGSRQRQRAQGT